MRRVVVSVGCPDKTLQEGKEREEQVFLGFSVADAKDKGGNRVARWAV